MFCVKVSLASTAQYSTDAAEAIKDLRPNAADLLVTSVVTSMVTDLGVVSPTAGALVTYYDGENNSSHTVDGYFVAPKNFNGNDHEEHRISMTYGGHIETCKGGNTFAIPGIYKVLDLIHNRYGSLPLEKLFEFPIHLANQGFKLTQPSKDYLKHSLEPLFQWHPVSKSSLQGISNDLENGVVVLSKLADTLGHMSTEGFNDFYKGDICNELTGTLLKEGGHATKEDFNDYKLIEDNKFETLYGSLKLTGHSGPSLGGLMVLKYLKALGSNEDQLVHNLIKIYKDRNTNYEFFGNRSEYIKSEIAKVSQSASTIQVNTSDDSNNHFSITFSSGYGSGVLCEKTGMYFNNSLGEIELNPQGFLADTKNDRLISNMSPMIVESDKGFSTIGSPGADRISSALAQVILNYSQSDDWSSSINKPRFHVNVDGTIRSEPNSDYTFDNQTTTSSNDMYFGGVCVTSFKEGLFAKGDPRRGDTSWIND
tara:strand:- start:2194 stop:3636 length:1443 start_codon:yes stop_codon:yes gene_type:complete